jgi:hypothetical protein
MLVRARSADGYGAIEGETESNDKNAERTSALRLRVVIAIRGDGSLLTLRSQTRYLQIIQPVSAQLAANAEALRSGYGECFFSCNRSCQTSLITC